MKNIIPDNDYKIWIATIKEKIASGKNRVTFKLNTALIEFYWELGQVISEKLELSKWGDKVLERVSTDLRSEFSEMKGLSITNLKYCKKIFEFYKFQIGQQSVDQFIEMYVGKIPWSHNVLIFNKSKKYTNSLPTIEEIENELSK